jgi:hypothetical protein
MKWEEIELASSRDFFQINGEKVFKQYLEAQKFHPPGLAPVRDASGWYHINTEGIPVYNERYDCLFGYYFERAVAVLEKNWFHIDPTGSLVYSGTYSWCGNYQESVCSVRQGEKYFHINLNGQRIYNASYFFAGDYRDGVACVRMANGLFKHIDKSGNAINDRQFRGVGVFHKGIATAQDEFGWFHIDLSGRPLYEERYAYLEPFYNGYALAEDLFGRKGILLEDGQFKRFST